MCIIYKKGNTRIHSLICSTCKSTLKNLKYPILTETFSIITFPRFVGCIRVCDQCVANHTIIKQGFIPHVESKLFLIPHQNSYLSSIQFGSAFFTGFTCLCVMFNATFPHNIIKKKYQYIIQLILSYPAISK